jgi:NADH-quinone oxidoreductase subunit H
MLFLDYCYVVLFKTISLFTSIFLFLGAIAFFTIFERKAMAAIQRRKGPNVVGFWGVLQAIADGLKLFFKEIIIPKRVAFSFFLISPMLVLMFGFYQWVIFFFSEEKTFTYINLTLLYFFTFSSFNVIAIFLSGWSSNSRYAFLGGVRAISQMLSYELIFALINLIIVILSESLNLIVIVLKQKIIWFIVPLLPVFVVFLIVILAETNRTPFDLSEAEAELVAGYNIEYSGIIFALFFLGEYLNMLFLSFIAVVYFFGGGAMGGFESDIFFICKILCISFFFIWIRATLPRYRFDQLMHICWKILLPFLLSYFIFVIFTKKFGFYFLELFSIFI